MKDVFQNVMLFVFMGSIAFFAEADELNTTLEAHFERSSDVQFVKYESVEQAHADQYGAYRYLVMDFKVMDYKTATASAAVLHNVHSICSSILKDIDLIKRLSNDGYDMISVSFDRESQYDCL